MMTLRKSSQRFGCAMAVTVLKKGSLVLAASVLLVAQAQATELLNSSYDVSRELFAALNPPFE